MPGSIISVDFEKAFDSVSHSFIHKVLKEFNFGPSIIKWINVFYKDAKSSILLNGFISESFYISRGCRQGDGLSPYIFLLCVEVLGMMIRQNKHINGIDIDHQEYKLSQYADDTVIVTNGSEQSMKPFMNWISL